MTIITLVGILAALYFLVNYVRGRDLQRKLDVIPTVGTSSGPFSFVANRWNFFHNARDIFQEGYEKYRGSVYKVRNLDNSWLVALASPKLLDELRKVPDEYLSAQEGQADILAIDYTLGKSLHFDPYQVEVVRGTLTRNIAGRFSEVKDEIVTAFSELLPPQDEWVPISLNPLMQKVICRASNRFFVGLPLCRNEDYIDLNINFTIQVITSGLLIRLFPDFLKPIIGNLISPLPGTTKRASKHLKLMLQERLAQEEDTPEKPNDLISWLLEEAHGYRREIDDLILRLLTINFGAIHTTSVTLTATLNYLTIYPQYIDELRAEIESTVEEHGWTKFAMGRMRKLDSFLKEVQRFEPAGCFGAMRKVLKDYTFADGTTVPAGVTVGVPVHAVQRDDACYPDGNIFDGFRFAKMRDNEGESVKHQMVTPTSDFFLFGNGRHACPGRFFAVNELKALVAHILLTYDIKTESEGGAKMKWYAVAAVQDNDTKFLFRKRRT